MDSTITRTYRRARSDGWLAQYALRFARDDAALQAAEALLFIRFEWPDDMDYVPDGDYDVEYEQRMLNAGTWEAHGCVAYVPKVPTCPNCSHPLGDASWDNVASLWGTVGPFDSTDETYRRSIEIDLAYEAGVLA